MNCLSLQLKVAQSHGGCDTLNYFTVGLKRTIFSLLWTEREVLPPYDLMLSALCGGKNVDGSEQIYRPFPERYSDMGLFSPSKSMLQ